MDSFFQNSNSKWKNRKKSNNSKITTQFILLEITGEDCEQIITRSKRSKIEKQ